jgi:ATP-grasp domain
MEESVLKANRVEIHSLNKPKRLRLPLSWAKFSHFEYFPMWLVYLPLVPIYIWQMLRTRSFAFFSAANPRIDMSGFFGESKIDILKMIPGEFLPNTLFFEKNTDIQAIMASLEANHLQFPIIVKPNIGERGTLVAKIENKEDLQKHIQTIDADFIIQEFIAFEIELGVLYHRLPNQSNGEITSITIKDFMKVKGDGVLTIAEILDQDLRYRFQLERLQKSQPEILNHILEKDEEKLLEPIGNHCRGTKFLNGNHLINTQLTQVFDHIASHIDEFYYGRFDLRVKSIEDLYAGKNIKILELNGISADPAHIYDPSLSIFKAYRDLAKHIGIMGRISRLNHRRGIPYTPSRELARRIYQYFIDKN